MIKPPDFDKIIVEDGEEVTKAILKIVTERGWYPAKNLESAVSATAAIDAAFATYLDDMYESLMEVNTEEQVVACLSLFLKVRISLTRHLIDRFGMGDKIKIEVHVED